MTHVFRLHNHQIISHTQQPAPRNPWLLWDITQNILALICFGGLLTALYIIA